MYYKIINALDCFTDLIRNLVCGINWHVWNGIFLYSIINSFKIN